MKNLSIWILLFLTACSSGDQSETEIDPSPPSPPSPPLLTKQEMPIVNYSSNIERLATFARVATSIQFYYPGKSGYDTDWDKFMAYGMYKIALTATEQDFVSQMEELFSQVSPEVVFNVENYQSETFANSDSVVAWVQSGYIDRKHQGSSLYYSGRETLTYGELLDEEVFTSNTSYHIDYGNLTMDMPLVLSAENASNNTSAQAFTEHNEWILPTSIESQYGCLSSFAKNWAVIQNYWPYFETIDVDWVAELSPMLTSCASSDRNQSVKSLHLAFTKLQDNHINIYGNFNAFPYYHTVPVGFELIEDKVITVFKSDDGADTQISVGDELIAVDGISVEELLTDLLPYSNRSESTRKSMAVKLNLLRSEFEKTVNLTLMNENSQSYQVELTANKNIWDIYYSTTDLYSQRSTTQHKVLEDNIHYIDLSITQAEDVQQTIAALADASAVVLDFRSYPEDWNGWRNTLAHFSDNDISAPPMFRLWTTAPDQIDPIKILSSQFIYPSLPKIDVPVIAISSRYSQSQNEHALAYIQNAGIPILGESTSGINGNVTFIHSFGGRDAGGMSVLFTGMEVTQNDGTAHIGVGIIPDINLARTIESIKQNKDNQLEAAIDYLRGRLEK